MDNRPIGIFDSGLGGLSVVRELPSVLPNERFVYFGDTGRVPYGSRSQAIIERYARQDCDLLLSYDVKYIIAACGTVSSVAGEVLQNLPVPAMGVVEPTAEAALQVTKNRRIGVIGTSLTVRSGSFEKAIRDRCPNANVFAEACPVLVTLVESGWIDADDPVTVAAVKRYVAPLMEQDIDTLILGCTHFPLLAPILSKVLGERVALVNSGAATAAACAKELTKRELLAKDGNGECRFLVSDRPQKFNRVAEMFLGRSVGEQVEQVDPEGVK